MNEFLQQFLIESRELVTQATEALLLLEKSPQDTQCLDSVFRAFHTLKGGAGIMEFAAMEHTVHAAEDVLMAARAGRRELDSALMDTCFTCLDQVSQWLDIVERTGELPMVTQAEAPATVAPQAEPSWLENLLNQNPEARDKATTAFRYVPDAECFYQGEDPVGRTSAVPELLALDLEPASPWGPLSTFDPYTCNLIVTGLASSSVAKVEASLRGHSGECEILAVHSGVLVTAPREARPNGFLPESARKILQEQMTILDQQVPQGLAGRVASALATTVNVLRYCGRVEPAARLAALGAQGEAASTVLRHTLTELLASDSVTPGPSTEPPRRQETVTRTLRVDADRIDALVRLTGELTVANNAIAHTAKIAQTGGDSVANVLKDQHGVLQRLIGQLQLFVIGMRVLPLRSVFQRFPRVLREMSASLGKPARLEVEGDDTEADKTIVEMLFEPLLHVLRNAIDHGIEDVNTRQANAKPPVATIRLKASRAGDQVLIEVVDDGQGMHLERIRSVARNRGVASEAELAAMTDADVMDLVFAAGFSTASNVTELSGRGVGMDAVRTAVEKVGGRVSLNSRAGLGTTVRFSLPFSVMMTQVMTVEAGGQIFGIPLDAIVETVRVGKEALSAVGQGQVLVHRERTIPVVELTTLLEQSADLNTLRESEVTVVIATAGGQLVGIRVDRPGERIEAILRPLEGLLAETPGVAGTTLLGDGRVLLVLDVGEMLR